MSEDEALAFRGLSPDHIEVRDEGLLDYIALTTSYAEEVKGLKRLLSQNGPKREFPPPRDLVGWLFEAIRAGDSWRAYLFLMNATSEENLTRLVNLPATEFAELLECLDPLRVQDRVDLLAGQQFTVPMLRFGFANHLVNKYGVRRIYGSVLDILGPIVDFRVQNTYATPPAAFRKSVV